MTDDAFVPAETAAAREAAPASGEVYEQELSRSLRVVGNVMITLSSITPASSVFIIIPLILVTVGTGSFLALAFAAIVGVFMAFCWGELCAELKCRFPLRPDWWSTVVVPPFQENWSVLWRRP